MFRLLRFKNNYSQPSKLSLSRKFFTTTTKRLTYALNKPKNMTEINSELNNNGFYAAKHPHKLSSSEKNKLQTELDEIQFFNENVEHQAAIIQTQFAIRKEPASFVIYPVENDSPFDIAYETLIESKPLLSSFAIEILNQLMHIDRLESYEGILFSIVLLKYSSESYLPPHQDDKYLFSLMTTLQAKNMIGTNGIYTAGNYGTHGREQSRFSDDFYKIVNNGPNGVFHDATIKVINQNHSDKEKKQSNASRFVLVAGAKYGCLSWIKPPFVRSNEDKNLLSVENSIKPTIKRW